MKEILLKYTPSTIFPSMSTHIHTHPTEWLSVSDAFGIDDGQVSHIVLYASLIQSLQTGNLLTFRGHNQLYTDERSISDEVHAYCKAPWVRHIGDELIR